MIHKPYMKIFRTCKYREIIVSTYCIMHRSNRFPFKLIVSLQAFGKKINNLLKGVLNNVKHNTNPFFFQQNSKHGVCTSLSINSYRADRKSVV